MERAVLTVLSWEPAANLDSCKALIKRFWEAVGIDDEDYQIGVELHAPDDWIGKCVVSAFTPRFILSPRSRSGAFQAGTRKGKGREEEGA